MVSIQIALAGNAEEMHLQKKEADLRAQIQILNKESAQLTRSLTEYDEDDLNRDEIETEISDLEDKIEELSEQLEVVQDDLEELR